MLIFLFLSILCFTVFNEYNIIVYLIYKFSYIFSLFFKKSNLTGYKKKKKNTYEEKIFCINCLKYFHLL